MPFHKATDINRNSRPVYVQGGPELAIPQFLMNGFLIQKLIPLNIVEGGALILDHPSCLYPPEWMWHRPSLVHCWNCRIWKHQGISNLFWLFAGPESNHSASSSSLPSSQSRPIGPSPLAFYVRVTAFYCLFGKGKHRRISLSLSGCISCWPLLPIIYRVDERVFFLLSSLLKPSLSISSFKCSIWLVGLVLRVYDFLHPK